MESTTKPVDVSIECLRYSAYCSLMPRASIVREVARSEIGQSFGKIGARADFAIAGGDQVGLALKHQEDAGCAGLKLTLFAGVLLFGGLAREAGGIQARAAGVTACKALRTSASTAMPTWFSTARRRRLRQQR